MEIQERANKYASEKTNEVMIQAIAQAYRDGYQDGYKDCEKEIPIEVQKDKTEFVDLGLPSGTLWAADYEKEDGQIKYLPYEKASTLSIPTEEQWKELLETCHWEFKTARNDRDKYFVCVGLNGNHIKFYYNGIVKDGENPENFQYVRFWVNDRFDGKNVVYMNGYLDKQFEWKYEAEQKKVYVGYGIPVRLVRK